MGGPGRAWRVIRLHHVAFAHRGDDTPGVLTDLLGLPCVHEKDAAGFTERMIPAGEAYLQLLEATGPGIIERFLGRRGPGLHHAAFEVSDIDEAVADLRSRGVRMVDETPRPGGMGTRRHGNKDRLCSPGGVSRVLARAGRVTCCRGRRHE